MASTSPKAAAITSRPERRNDLDWLRVIAVLLLIPFHSARVFSVFDPFYVDDTPSYFLSYVVVFLDNWQMPLLFLLAGAATWYALDFRSGAQYVAERLRRLILPFVVGVLVVVPPQMYYAQKHHAAYSGSYLDYLPSFFQSSPEGASDYFGVGYSFAHLWFILFLFVISLVLLPIFLYLKGNAGARQAIASVLAHPVTLFLLTVPVALILLAPEIWGHSAFHYLLVVFLGFLLMSDSRYGETLDKYRRALLAIAVAGTVAYLAAVIVLNVRDEDSPGYIAWALPFAFSIWFCLLAIVAYGRRLLTSRSPLLTYASEAAYPFYILHQTVIVGVAYYVVEWQTDAVIKWIAIMLISLVLTLGIYDMFIRKLNPVRVLFGMKTMSPRSPRAQVRPPKQPHARAKVQR